jgi:hypothetical protein
MSEPLPRPDQDTHATGTTSSRSGDDYRLKLYQTYRTRIQNEEMLINQRVSYLLTSQAFLLAPYVLSYTSDINRIRVPANLAAFAALQRKTETADLISEYSQGHPPVDVVRLSDQQKHIQCIQTVMPFAGVWACLLTLCSIAAAIRAISINREDYRSLRAKLPDGGRSGTALPLDGPIEELSDVPPLQSGNVEHQMGLVAPVGLTVLVGVVWAILIVQSPHRSGLLEFIMLSVTLLIAVGLLLAGFEWFRRHVQALRRQTSRNDVLEQENATLRATIAQGIDASAGKP